MDGSKQPRERRRIQIGRIASGQQRSRQRQIAGHRPRFRLCKGRRRTGQPQFVSNCEIILAATVVFAAPLRPNHQVIEAWWRMNMLSRVALIAGLATMMTASAADRQNKITCSHVPVRFSGSLSVLTFNIKGLPWPVALGRASALSAIAQRLATMRRRGNAPQIVVLQETFTADARAIGTAAGYRYVIDGPAAADVIGTAQNARDRAFALGARWWRGETEGKFVGSGLQILSDYPVTAAHKRAFPAFACAGFDCLANKGALLVTVSIPGAGPIDVLTTHLNSRHASRANDERSLYAYDLQIAALSKFVKDVHDPRLPLIAAGDFNVGSASLRRVSLLASVRGWSASPVGNALSAYRANGGALRGDAAYSFRRARDWQFFASGVNDSLKLSRIAVPFGHDPAGKMLSDHVGYVAQFQLRRFAASFSRQITRSALSKT